MREKVLSFLLACFAVALRASRSIGLVKEHPRSALILPPAAPGSLGDEAMVSSTVDTLTAKGIDRIGLVAYVPNIEWRNQDFISETVLMGRYFSRGSWREAFRFTYAASHYNRFYFLGADVVDGHYSDFRTVRRIALVSLASKVGCRAAILGFSFNDQPTPASIQALRDLPSDVRLCARDPVSRERLVRHLKRPIELVADLAFLLRPDVDSEVVQSVLQWIREQRAMGRMVIGINANPVHLRSCEIQSADALSGIYVEVLLRLHSMERSYSYLLLPHDHRGKVSDVLLSESIYERLPAGVQIHCMKVLGLSSAAETKAVCGALDMALSGRMHLAIACLGQGTPVACIDYQDKFEGLFEHFALEGMVIEPEQAFRKDGLVNFFVPLVERAGDFRDHIEMRVPAAQELARSNFD